MFWSVKNLIQDEITSFRDPWPNNLKSPKVNLSKTADCFILLAKEQHPSESPDLVNIENGNAMKMAQGPLLMDDFASLAKSGAAMSRCDPYQYYFKQ